MKGGRFIGLVMIMSSLLGPLTATAEMTQTASAPAADARSTAELQVNRSAADADQIPPPQLDRTPWQELAVPSGVPYTSPLLLSTPVLTVTKDASPSPVEAGQVLSYTIVISNPSQLEDATGVTISDTLPADVSFVAGSVVITPTSAGGTTDSPPIIASGITVTTASLVTVTYAVTVSQPLTNGVTIVNTAAITSNQVATPTIGTVTSTVASTPSVHLVKSGPTTANVGDTVVFTFTVTNVGNTLLRDVVVEDDYAGTASFSSGDNSDGWLDLTEAWLYTATYTIPPTTTAPLTNTAVVAAADASDTQATASASHSTFIEFNPALTITKTGPLTATVGQVVVYTYTVTKVSITLAVAHVSHPNKIQMNPKGYSYELV
jgi:uncharacterized repeat protein (TIGR01451 family)